MPFMMRALQVGVVVCVVADPVAAQWLQYPRMGSRVIRAASRISPPRRLERRMERRISQGFGSSTQPAERTNDVHRLQRRSTILPHRNSWTSARAFAAGCLINRGPRRS
jgi:hypothetical protein